MRTMLLTSVVAAGVGMAFGVDVMTAEPGSLPWTTVHAKTVSLAVDWPEKATEAWLITSDIREKVIREERIPVGAESVSWTAFEGDAPTEDALYSLRLQFYTGTTEGRNLKPFSNSMMTLAVLRGAFGDGVEVASDTTDDSWRQVSSKGFFVGCDSAWVGGKSPCVLSPVRAETPLFATTNALSSGWTTFAYNKSKWQNREPFTLVAAFGGTDETLSADLEFLVPGTLLLLR